MCITMEKWITERLSDCLGFPVPDDLVQYILSIKNNRDLEDYLGTLLDFDNSKHRLFRSDLLQRRSNTGVVQKSYSNQNVPLNQTNKKKKSKSSPQSMPAAAAEPYISDVSMRESTGAIKKKTKFVNLYSQEGNIKNVVLLKGRHHCDCQGGKHKLINNCLHCGRIVCEQEGSGPCLFCGNLVCSKEEQQLMSSGTRKSDALYNRLMEQKRPQGWEAALAQRNLLLEYDRTSEKRTKVIDDESDYYMSSSVWLSKTEREKLQKHEKEMMERRHASRLTKKVTLDFAGRQIIEETLFDPELEESLLRQMADASDTKHGVTSPRSHLRDAASYGVDIHPDYDGRLPIFDDSVLCNTASKITLDCNSSLKSQSVGMLRVQDRELQEMSDRGVCLSMHQPWASLLILGIKKHEGRSWYSAHRGRLWIAATAKPVDPAEIKNLEHFYTILYKDENIKFPSQYPSGCLLGCVSVYDCLAQEEYRQQYPEGESDSPYVFICKDPHALPIHFPIKGQHKIYKLDTRIHQAAAKSLFKMCKLADI